MESIKNIAARHKMSEGAIKQNLLRNKRNLKKILERKEKRCWIILNLIIMESFIHRLKNDAKN